MCAVLAFPAPSESRTLTIAQVARDFSVSESWLYHHWRELPHFRVGRSIRFDSALLRRHFQARYQTRTGSRPNLEGGIPMGLRRYQRGSVVKQGKRIKAWYGIWREDVRLPDGGFFRRKRKVRLGAVNELSRSRAYDELARRMNTKPTAALTFSDLVERWERAIAPTIRPSTRTYYQKELRVHLIPAFGERQVAQIERCDLEYFLADQAKKYCRNTLRGMRVAFGRVFSWAVANNWVEKNPAAGVALPQAGKRILRTVLKPEQVLAIVDRLEEPSQRSYCFWLSLASESAKPLPIRWEDFDGDVIHIRRRLTRARLTRRKPKSRSPSADASQLILARLRLLGGTDWVFRNRHNGPINPGNTLKRYVRPVVKELESRLADSTTFATRS